MKVPRREHRVPYKVVKAAEPATRRASGSERAEEDSFAAEYFRDDFVEDEGRRGSEAPAKKSRRRSSPCLRISTDSSERNQRRRQKLPVSKFCASSTNRPAASLALWARQEKGREDRGLRTWAAARSTSPFLKSAMAVFEVKGDQRRHAPWR